MENEIEYLRSRINAIDSQILRLLAERRELSREIVKHKKESGKAVKDEKREEELLNKLIEAGREYGLSSYYVMKIFYEIIDDSVQIQNQSLSKRDGDRKDC